MEPAALAILETIELPPLSAAARSAYQSNMHGADSAPLNALHRQLALDEATAALQDLTRAPEERERIARAYFRCAAWDALAGNEFTEYQKSWRVKWAKGRAEQERILAAWSATTDPHAQLIVELRAALPAVGPVDIAAYAATICHGWSLSTPDREQDYEPSPKVIRKKIAALAAKPAIVGAVQRWLPTLDAADYERRALHAGVVLAADGSAASAALLAPMLAEADTWPDANDEETPRNRAWIVKVWSKLAPAGSAVAALLGITATPPSAGKAKPAANKAAAKKPPVAKKPVAKQPVAKKPVAKKPAAKQKR